jgi:hypothetical protein
VISGSLDCKLQPCNFGARADKILDAMNDQDPDESFLDFLARRFPDNKDDEAKRWATGYVSGFNAADPGEVSVHWLVHNREAEEQIEGDRAFHILGGYLELLDIFAAELARLNVPASPQHSCPQSAIAKLRPLKLRRASTDHVGDGRPR